MPAGRWVGVLALAGVCLVAGWAAAAADPPGTAVVWPPVGVALAALYARGRRLWPAVAVAAAGVFATQAGRYGDRPAAAVLGEAALLGLVYAAQAAAGVWLLRRLVGRAAPLVRPREIGWFLLVAGPGHALVGPTLGCLVVCAFGGWQWGEFPARWAAWWGSDAAGGLLFAPLTLALVGRPRAVWGPRGRTVAVPVAVAVALTAAGYLAARDAANGAARTAFTHAAADKLRETTAGAQEVEAALSARADGGDRSAERFDQLRASGVLREATVADPAAESDWAGLVAEARLTGRPAAGDPVVSAGRPVVRVAAAGRGPAGRLVAVELDPAGWLQAAADELGAGVTVTLARPDGDPDPGPGRTTVRAAFPVAGRAVPVTVTAPGGALAAGRPLFAAAAGLVGVLLCTLFTGVLLATTGHGALVAEEVTARTAALNAEVEARRAAENFLRDSEAKLLDAQRLARLGYWEWRPDRDTMYWSPVLAEMLGFLGSDRRLELDDLLVRVHADDRPGVRAALETARTSRRAVQFEFRTAGHGQPKWLSATVTAAPGAAPGPVRGTVFDLTERKRAELAAREGKARLAIALHSARMGTWEWDVGTDRLRWDDRNQTLFGFAPGGFDGRLATFLSLVHPDDRPGLNAAIGRAVDAGAVFEEEFRIVRPGPAGPEVRWLGGYGQVMAAADGQPDRMAGINFDVTDRKRAELAVREAETRQRLALDAGRMGTLVWDPASDELAADGTACALFGAGPGELPGTMAGLLDRVLPADLPRVIEVHGGAVRAGPGADCLCEFRVPSPDGGVRWLSASGRVVRDAAAGRDRLYAVLADVTGRLEAEHALRVSEANLAMAQAIARVGSFDWDVPTGLTYWSDEMYRLLGYAPRSVQPTLAALMARVHPDDRGLIAARMDATLNRGEPYRYEFRVVHPQGGARVVSVEAVAVRDAAGAVVTLRGTNQDVTDRLRAEEAVRDSEARLAEAQRIARLGSWEADVATGEVRASATAYELFGLDPAEPVTPPRVLDMMPADDRARAEQTLAGLVAGGGRAELEHRVVRPDGETRHMSSRAVAVPGTTRMVGTTQDVTERRREEEERREFHEHLQETQKLESLGILAGGVAHDFNNLLTGILGNASLAREIVPATSELHEFLRPIEKSAEHAAQLCQQMLAYAGRGGAVRGPVDLNRVVEESADLLRLAVSKRAVLTLDLSPDLPTVVGDAGELRQVVLNLVQNASEALPDRGGPVAVRTGHAAGPPALDPDTATASGDLPAGEHVWLEVADGGAGMDAATRARIFEPFFTTKFTGRGLGLSAVQGIARAHGGAVCVLSTPGVGTTFRVLVPCAADGAGAWAGAPGTDAGVSDLTPPPVPWRATERMAALVADGEALVRSLAGVALRGLGFRVVEAETGAGAVEAFRADPNQYRLALVDLTAPGFDGRAVFAAVRAVRPDLPVVFLTDYDALDFDPGPGTLYLQKPFRAADLTSCVRRAVGTTALS